MFWRILLSHIIFGFLMMAEVHGDDILTVSRTKRGDNILIVNKINIIRFYERQYFKGHHWTLNQDGNWTSSRRTRMKVPYRNFQPKSVRTICSSECRWHICPMQRRKYQKTKRTKGCKVVVGNHDIENLFSWGWSNELLGRTRKLPRKRKKVKEKKRKKNIDITTDYSTTSLPLDEGSSNINHAPLPNEDWLTNSSDVFHNRSSTSPFPTPGKLI